MSDLRIARGDLLLDEDLMPLASPISGVNDADWTQFVGAMIVQDPGVVSESNGLGMFDMKPRRLADLGYVKKLSRGDRQGRQVWLGAFVPPWTPERFLGNQPEQYTAFSRSMVDYATRIREGKLACPDGVTLSGALAILHRAGPKGLDSWSAGEVFPETQLAYARAAGVF